MARDHIHGAQLIGLQLQRIHVNHDLAVPAAIGRRNGGAGNAGNLISNLELQVVVKLRLAQPLAFHGQQANGQARGVHLITTGGSVPCGRRRKSAMARLEIWVTSALASVPGWK